MNEIPFTILETACANTPNDRHYLILQARDVRSGDIVWAIGDDHGGAIASADFVRNRAVNYKDVCMHEFLYQENPPERTGKWLPLIQELVRCTLKSYLDHDGKVCVCPQWLPEEIELSIGSEVFQTIKNGIRYVLLYDNGMMEIVV